MLFCIHYHSQCLSLVKLSATTESRLPLYNAFHDPEIACLSDVQGGIYSLLL